jgi:hypothetical protein
MRPRSVTQGVQRAAAVLAASWVAACAAGEPAIDFNRDVRPILAENCLYCHGQDPAKREADLRLDVREAAVAARAIVAGEPGASALLERIHSTDPDVVMPPPDSNRRLTDDQRATLDRWIREGAAYEPHWAFVPPVRPTPPSVRQARWPRNEIDRFVLANLEAAGLEPSPEADRTTLLRRLHADLVGIPPTPDEIDAFVADESPDAYERAVDRLLASPHYGERMALPWLDAARYADSNGFQQDGDTWQWIWRDWVVKALNDDMPFDRFSIEQLAGDLLPNATADQKIASGFNRNHLLNGEGGAIPEEQRFNNLFDRVDTTCTTWLAITMACCQCHDHKYDPFTRHDYYALLDAFNRVPESGMPTRYSARIRVAPPVVELPSEADAKRLAELEAAMKAGEKESRAVIDAAYAAWRRGLYADGEPADGEGLPRDLTPLLRKPEKDRTADEKKQVEQKLRQFFDGRVKAAVIKDLPQVKAHEAARAAHDDFKGDRIPRVMVMSDAQPRQTRLLDRGDYLSPHGDPIAFATPATLPPLPADLPRNRLGLARWLFLPEHPLTARVQANRMWQHFFGVGIVKTAEDLGVQSEYPIHGPLLDWLAVEFLEPEGDASAARDDRHLPAGEPRHGGAPGQGSREPAARAGGAVPHAVDGAPRRGPLGRGPARPADRRPAGVSLPARRDLGVAGDHQGARLHLSGVPRHRPLPPQPVHVLAADGEPGQHVRRGQPADLHGAGESHLHAAARARDAQRPHLGRGRQGARRGEREGGGRPRCPDHARVSTGAGAAALRQRPRGPAADPRGPAVGLPRRPGRGGEAARRRGVAAGSRHRSAGARRPHGRVPRNPQPRRGADP